MATVQEKTECLADIPVEKKKAHVALSLSKQQEGTNISPKTAQAELQWEILLKVAKDQQ